MSYADAYIELCSRKEMELFPCGSRSSRSTRRPFCANAAARLTAVVVFPTPPFWFAIAMIVLKSSRSVYREFQKASELNTESHRQVPCFPDHVGPFLFGG